MDWSAINPETSAEIVVIANACTDDTQALVASWAAPDHTPRLPVPIRCIAEPRTGLNHARNRAVAEARYDLLAMLDDDVYVAPDWLHGLLEAYRTTPASIIAGHIELWWEAVPRPDWLTPGMEMTLSCLDRGPAIIELHQPDAIGANFSFKREVFDRVGPFAGDLDRVGAQLLSGGETFFVRRAMHAGFRLFYSPRASLKHWVAPHRIQPPYLTGVAFGNAFSIVAMKDRFGPLAAARTLTLGALRFGGHSLLAPAAGLLGLHGTRMQSLVRRAIGRGQFKGALARLRSGPPTI